MDPIEAHPVYPALRAFKQRQARSLMARYGAHGLGIRWKPSADAKTRAPALVFYVDPQTRPDGCEPIPPRLLVPAGDGETDVEVETMVIESPPAGPEGSAG